MSKCALPAKREGHQNGTILQTQEGSYEAETAGGFFLRFCLPFLSRHLPPPRYHRKKKVRRNRFGAGQKKEVLQKAVRTVRRKNRQGRGKLPSLYAAVGVRRRSYGVSRIHRSTAGRIKGHRRSFPQPSSAAWCPPPLHRSRAYSPHVASY